MMTTNEMDARKTPASAATAPTNAYAPGAAVRFRLAPPLDAAKTCDANALAPCPKRSPSSAPHRIVGMNIPAGSETSHANAIATTVITSATATDLGVKTECSSISDNNAAMTSSRRPRRSAPRSLNAPGGHRSATATAGVQISEPAPPPAADDASFASASPPGISRQTPRNVAAKNATVTTTNAVAVASATRHAPVFGRRGDNAFAARVRNAATNPAHAASAANARSSHA
mmetsp:Transcript_5451/g.19697  ORF Transcript_5451/g.19697 Transcript_5451/m.19697 type:complete len:230 (+) Transcript_5451:1185-1874(+)